MKIASQLIEVQLEKLYDVRSAIESALSLHLACS